MKYFVRLFQKNGSSTHKYYFNARSHRGALRQAPNWLAWEHALVLSESRILRRYKFSATPKLIHAEPRYFKSTEGLKFALLVVSNKFNEVHRFDTQSKRDEAYEKCLTSILAASANPDKEHNDITASSVETSGSKSGLTLKRISNGSARNVTWLDSLIHFSTAPGFGTSKSESTEEPTWSGGSTPSHSRPDPIFATVKNLDDVKWTGIGISESMKDMVGNSYKFRPVMSSGYGWLWEAKGWKFKLEWLEIVEIPMPKIVKQKTGKFIGGKGERLAVRTSDIEAIKPAIGETMTFTATKTPGHWKMPSPWGYVISESWIEFERTAKVLDGSKIPHKTVTWLSRMKKLVGQVVTLKESINENVYYVVPRNGAGWYMAKEWLDLDYEKQEISDDDMQKLKNLAQYEAIKKKVKSYYSKSDEELESLKNELDEEEKKKWKMLSATWAALPTASKIHTTDGA